MSFLSEQFIQKAIINPLQNQKCSQLHPGQSCNGKAVCQFFATCKAVYKIYLLVHLLPFIIFKRKNLKEKPLHEIRKLVQGFIQSMLFAGGYTVIVRKTICFFTQHYKYTSEIGVLGAFLAGSSLCFQPVGRQSQIAMFCVNKSLQTVYHMARRRNYPVRIPNGECLLLGLALGIISYHYIDCPKAIRSNYMSIIQRLIGNI